MKNKRSGFFIVVCGFLLFQMFGQTLAQKAGAAPENGLVLENAGFEEEQTDGTIPGWTQSFGTEGISVVNTEQASGAKSLEIKDSGSGNYGLISDQVPVNPGWQYTASAKMKSTGGSGEIYIRFFDSKGSYITGFNKAVNGPVDEWSEIKVSADAPANAVYAAVLFYSGKANTGTFYFDEALLTEAKPIMPIGEEAENLGVQVSKTTVMLGDIGKDANGNDVLYTVVAGAPAKFAIVDVETEELIKSYPLEDTSGAWGVKVAADGSVYLGGYNQGYLYRYLPETDSLLNLGHPVKTTDAVLYPMDISSDGKIYGGTYGSGSVYEYDPDSGQFTNFGTMAEGQSWVRSTAYDEKNQRIYAGVGSKAHLIEYDIKTGTKRNILPSQYADIISVYDLNLIQGKLFAQKESSYEMFIIDTESGELVEAMNEDTGLKTFDIPESSRGISGKSPVGEKVYFTHLGILHEYDLKKNSFKSLGADLKGSAISYKFLQLKEEGFPGYTLVGLSGNGGKLYKYNLETGKLKLTDLALPAEPVQIHELAKGPDGKIYSTGYLPGNMGAYIPTSGKNIVFDGIGQSEGTATLNGKMYLGIYPNARIYEFDPFKEWNRTDSDSLNPGLLFSLEKNEQIPGYTPQDRPFAMLGVPEHNQLFIGTVPKNGNLGGALAIYEPGTGKEPDVYWNIMQDQSIVSLTHIGGKVFGGTTVAGGQGSVPATSEAKLFVWDIENKQKTAELIPVPGKKAITALTIGADGNIWGMADGTLFALDPESIEVIASYQLDDKTSSNWRNASLEIGTDGNIYGIIGRKFFKFNPQNGMQEFIAGDVDHLAQDDFGSFYLSSGIHLYKYSDENLLGRLKGAEIIVEKQRLTAGDSLSVKVKGILDNGKSTFELDGAVISYKVGKEKVLSVEDGIIKALKSGKTEISAVVELDGAVAEAPPVSIWVNNKGGRK
ncbi:carbohydrate binding domain-containing protein [Bacillus sp. MMSF_3328]|uniref:carbohydrate binding domain-containing protein n=1 Tax=Bacillus sp. MMSF_3328 TaxID=3047080 RepID=UPI00273CFA37|nr:carbohydrate binding domain-containing protein [Bacillus sp. MMSF_3328]